MTYGHYYDLKMTIVRTWLLRTKCAMMIRTNSWTMTRKFKKKLNRNNFKFGPLDLITLYFEKSDWDIMFAQAYIISIIVHFILSSWINLYFVHFVQFILLINFMLYYLIYYDYLKVMNLFIFFKFIVYLMLSEFLFKFYFIA